MMAISTAHYVVIYFFMCCVTTAVGYGLIAILRLEIRDALRPFLAPVLTFTLWVIVLGVFVALAVPVKRIAPWLWGGSLLLAVVGGREIGKSVIRSASLQALISAFKRIRSGVESSQIRPDTSQDTIYLRIKRYVRLTPLPVLAMVLVWILPGLATIVVFAGHNEELLARMTDGWAYHAGAAYFWEYPRDGHGGLPPLFQFGTVLYRTRYISSAFLGFFSPLVHAGDPRSVTAIYLLWCMFVLSCVTLLFWIVFQASWWFAMAGTTISILAGWITDALWANNYDHFIGLVYFPASVAVVKLLSPRQRAWWFVLGGLIAGAVYTYTELAVFVGLGVSLIALSQFVQDRMHWRTWLIGSIAASVFCVVLLLPFYDIGKEFIQSQIGISEYTNRERPGENYFRNIATSNDHFSVFFGLGGEWGTAPWATPPYAQLRNVAGAFLVLPAAIGAFLLAKRREWGIVLALSVFIGSAFYYSIARHYSYPTYKLLAYGWWLIALTIIMGMKWLVSQIRTSVPRRDSVTCMLFIVIIMCSQCYNYYWEGKKVPAANTTNIALSNNDYRQVESIVTVTGHQPVLLLVDDWLANEWAIYYLRNSDLRLGNYRLFTAFFEPKMRQAKAIPSQDLHFVLTGTEFNGQVMHWQEVWAQGPYKLWRMSDMNGLIVTRLADTRGIITPDPASGSFWITDSPATASIIAGHDGTILVNANFQPGPSLPETPTRRVMITTTDGYSQEFSLQPGPQSLPIPVTIGENTVTIHVLDTASLPMLPNGDQRKLLLQVNSFGVQFSG